MKALVSSDKLPAPAGPYSPGVTVGEWIFLSGQGGFDPDTGKVVSNDLVEQTEQTFNNIESVLEAAGASIDDVISCLVHLVDLADFPAFNAVYEQKFTGVKPVDVGHDRAQGRPRGAARTCRGRQGDADHRQNVPAE